jgi:hypothetical protein
LEQHGSSTNPNEEARGKSHELPGTTSEEPVAYDSRKLMTVTGKTTDD